MKLGRVRFTHPTKLAVLGHHPDCITTEPQFEKFYQEYEEDKNMQYVTSVERRGIQKGLLQQLCTDVVKILRLRFKRVPKTLVAALETIEDTSRLSKFLEQAVLVDSLDEFKQLVNKSV